MKKTLILAAMLAATAMSSAIAGPIGTGQETWQHQNTMFRDHTVADWERGQMRSQDMRHREMRAQDMRAHDDRMMQDEIKRKCKKKKNKKACMRKAKEEMRRDRMDHMDREGGRMDRSRTDRNGHRLDPDNRWHSYDRQGERHMDIDQDGRRW